MSTPAPNRRRFLSMTAIALGLLAVVAVTVSFFAGDPWLLRISALLVFVLALAIGRTAWRQPPPVDGP